jgi:predicted nucleic acid-binding protein
LIDERKGTSIAKAHSLNPRGVLGLIRELKLLGIIQEARPLFEECRRHGFWLNDDLVTSILKELGENL